MSRGVCKNPCDLVEMICRLSVLTHPIRYVLQLIYIAEFNINSIRTRLKTKNGDEWSSITLLESEINKVHSFRRSQ